MKKAIARTDQISHEKFIEIRRHFLGGSDIGAVSCVNPFKSPLEVWLEKTGRTNGEIEDNEKMFWGRALEPVIRESFQTITGKKTEPVNMMFTCTEADFLLATPDAIVREDDGSVSVLEIKTTSAYNADAWSENNYPASYYMQLQQYLYVLGLNKGYLCCLIGGQKLVWYEIPRDNETIAYMLAIGQTFWQENVLKDVMPEITANSTNGLNHLYPTSNDSNPILALSDEEENWAKAIIEIDEAIGNLQEARTGYENNLKNRMGASATAITPNGYKIKWQSTTTNRLDTNRLKKEHFELIQAYSKTTSSRRFSITEPKAEAEANAKAS